MKILIFSLLAIGTLSMSACKDNKEQTANTTMQHDMKGMKDGQMMEGTNMTVTAAKKSSANLDELTLNYMELTSALANDDDGKAASVGKNIVQSLAKIDQSSFSTEQKKGSQISSLTLKNMQNTSEKMLEISNIKENIWIY
nr:DUF3347 domain-containing protein [Kaistella sp. 97-N-M2]